MARSGEFFTTQLPLGYCFLRICWSIDLYSLVIEFAKEERKTEQTF